MVLWLAAWYRDVHLLNQVGNQPARRRVQTALLQHLKSFRFRGPAKGQNTAVCMILRAPDKRAGDREWKQMSLYSSHSSSRTRSTTLVDQGVIARGWQWRRNHLRHGALFSTHDAGRRDGAIHNKACVCPTGVRIVFEGEQLSVMGDKGR